MLQLWCPNVFNTDQNCIKEVVNFYIKSQGYHKHNKKLHIFYKLAEYYNSRFLLLYVVC